MSLDRVNRDAEPPSGDFYVTVRDGPRYAALLGPFEDLRDALGEVKGAKDAACKADPFAHFYSYGTSRITGPVKPVFGGPAIDMEREGR